MNNSQSAASGSILFEKFSSGVRKTFSSTAFLLLTILASVLTLTWLAFLVISALNGNAAFSILGGLSFAGACLLAVGCWLLYIGADNGIKLTKIYLMARTIISGIFLVIGILTITILVDRAMGIALPEITVFEEMGMSWAWAFVTVYLVIFIIVALLVIYLLVVALFVVRAIRFHTLYKTMDNVGEAMKSGYGFDFHPGTPATLSFIAAAVDIIGGAVLIILGMSNMAYLILGAAGLVTGIMTIFDGLTLISAKKNIAEYDALNSAVMEQKTGTKTATKVFFLMGVVTSALTVIPLIWCIPMLKRYFSSTKHGGEPLSTKFKVCTLLFVNPIAGVLLLCDKG